MSLTKGLDIFTPKEKITDIVKSRFVRYRPITAIRDNCCIEFSIPANAFHYIDLNNVYLGLTLTMTKADGSPFTGVHTGLCDNVLASIFSQVEFSINDFVVSPSGSSNYHPYRCYFEALLNTPTAGEMEQMQHSAGFSFRLIRRNTENIMKKLDWERMKEKELRSLHIGLAMAMLEDQGGKDEFYGRLQTDACTLEKFLPNGCSLRISLYPSSDAFRIITLEEEQYHLHIKDAALTLCHLELSPSQLIKQEEQFAEGPAVYEFMKNDIRTFHVPSGSFSAEFENISGGRVPCEIIMGLVSSEGFNGSYKRDPLRFYHYNLNMLCVSVDGVSVPGPPLKPDYSGPHYMCSEAMFSLFNKDYRPVGYTIDYYGERYCIYRFDLNGHLDCDSMPEKKNGNVRVNLNFAKPLSEGVTLVMALRFPEVFYIDKERNVFA